MEAVVLIVSAAQVESAAWNDVVNVPLAVVGPTHAGDEFGFEVRLEFGDRTTNKFNCPATLSCAFERRSNPAT
jgi:hypothetical protein